MKKIHFSIFSAFTFVLLSCSTLAQMRYSTSSKSAIKLFEAALASPNKVENVQNGHINYSEGIKLLTSALKKDPNFIEAHQLMADYLISSGHGKEAIDHLRTVTQINPSADPSGVSYYLLADLLFKYGEYDEAMTDAETYLKYSNKNEQYAYKANLLVQSCEFAKYAKQHSYAFNPINMGPAINTKNPEYFPTITVDGKTFLFTRRLPAPENPLGAQEDFFVSVQDENGTWQPAVPMPNNINSGLNEGSPTLSPDGKSLIFVACPDITGRNYGEGRVGKGSCDLYITKQLGSRWLNPKNLPGGVNTFNWETQPSLSSDGKTLYFVRGFKDRNGMKQQDIFQSSLLEDGTWSQAQRLPDIINTPFNEESVLIHPDGKTLYFSSDGHPGMGGLDIFMSTQDDEGNWSRPINLGYPINTEYDENSLLVGPDGEVAYFASNREGGYGGLDLYAFEMPEHLRPVKTIYMDGTVYDFASKNPLGAHFQLIDLKTGKIVVASDADKVNGSFMVSLPTKRDYALNVSYPGYNFYSKNFTLTVPENDKPYHIDVPLQALLVNASVTLENVFFDLGKYSLRKESAVELDKLVAFLTANPSIYIEIGGYTDTRGDAKENQLLSENRAKSVYSYLISKGVNAARISYKGYGESQPEISDEEIALLKTDAEKEAAHQKNRRTAYKIVKN
jgi:outer membrane protein OmpA-like peptidoglycan-associated protein/tetratricopeptide (TPR) repeat protein